MHDTEMHRRLASCEAKIDKVLTMLKEMKMTQQELADSLKTITAQVAKIGTESTKTLALVTDLEAQIANAGNVSQPVIDAFQALKAQVQVVDDLIPDAPPTPAPTPAPTPTPAP